MKDFILFTISEISLTRIGQLFSEADYFLSVENSELYVSSKSNEDDFFKIRDIPSIIESYDSDELKFVSENIGSSFKVFLCNYKDVEFVKKLVKIIGKEISLIVDNDFDDLMTGQDFIDKSNQEPGWDWTG